MTEWRTVPGWEGWYVVPDDGQVASVDRLIVTPDGQRQHHKGKPLSPYDKAGYQLARLRNGSDGRAVMIGVHRLVALAFIPNPNEKPFINHIDCNPGNNQVGNLEWCTQEENLRHSRDLGRMPGPWKGKRTPVAKLSDDQVKAIRAIYAAGGLSLEKVAAKFSVSKRTIHRVIQRRAYADVQ